jgi:hypothetical protein
MMTGIIVASLLCFMLSLSVSTVCYADTAEVLPKGVQRLAVDSNFYSTIEERYDEDGKDEDIDSSFNAVLDSSIFPALSLVEAAFIMPPGSANIGASVVDFDYDITEIELSFQYGITDRLTAGIMIPYHYLENSVSARLDTSGATVGKSAALGIIAPIGFADTVPLTDEDVQDLLGNGLDINGDGAIDVPGFGYKRFEDWSYDGIGDIQVGLKYQYLRTEDWRLAFTGGVGLPAGEIDDEDNLTDLTLGRGAYSALFRFHNDYIGIKNLLLNATLQYDLVFPYHQRLRISSINQPITRDKENVEIDRGDVFNLELSGTYRFWEAFGLSLMYKFGYTLKDSVSGDEEFDYDLLEEETRSTQHVGKVTLSYSTIPLFKAKKFPVPLTAYVSYRNRFAGKNNSYKSQYIGVGISVFF